jgi:hypothetical protein
MWIELEEIPFFAAEVALEREWASLKRGSVPQNLRSVFFDPVAILNCAVEVVGP